MIPLKEVREQINLDGANWQMYLMDFVEEFRRTRDRRAINEAFQLVGDDKDALLASAAEALCDEFGLPVPEWLSHVPACADPYFVAGLEDLKAITIVESPLRFRLRKIFVLENFLDRV